MSIIQQQQEINECLSFQIQTQMQIQIQIQIQFEIQIQRHVEISKCLHFAKIFIEICDAICFNLI